MKSEKRQRQNPSSKVLMGLAAVGATGSASGAIVQIDLINNQITAGGGNQLNADVTGDMMNDVGFLNSVASTFGDGNGFSGGYVRINGVGNSARATGGGRLFLLVAGMLGSSSGPAFGSGVIPIMFNSVSLGGSEMQSGLLSVTAGGVGATRGVTLNSVFFDSEGASVDASTDVSGATLLGSTENGVFTAVPEPSSLALLALGAGGLLTRRQRKKAA